MCGYYLETSGTHTHVHSAHTQMHIHTNIYIHTYIYKHIHTHTQIHRYVSGGIHMTNPAFLPQMILKMITATEYVSVSVCGCE